MSEQDENRLQRRAERERRARLEAEAIAESITRELYQSVQDLRSSNERVEEAHRYLGLLQRAAVAANEAETFEDAAARVIDDVVDTTGWTVGHLYVADEARTHMIPTAVWTLVDPEAVRAFRTATEATPMPRGTGLPGRVMASGRPAWIVDVTRDDNFPRAKLAEEIGVRAGFGFPVLVGRSVEAVLEFFAPEPAEPDEAMLEVMGHIGTQLGRVVERMRAEAAIRASEARNRLIVETADDAFVAIDAESRILEWNRAAVRVFGWTREEILGQTLPDTIIPERHRDAHLQGLSRFIATGSGTVIGRQLELTARRRDGRELAVELTPWVVGEGDAVRFNAFVTDITERKEFERQLRHQALHDSLTGLPNRALLLDRLGHALAKCRRESCITAVLFIDLDRFKAVNDNFGHDGGDRLLLEVADRLRSELRPGDTVARLGGDEFVVLCEGLGSRHEAAAIAERLVTRLRAPVTLQGAEVAVSASVGVAVTHGDSDPEQLLADADLAMYRAKERRNGVYELFDESMRMRLAERLAIETALRVGIPAGQVFAHFQPVVSLADGRWHGVEALARWRHPDRGMVPPSEFIAVAEETGLIASIGDLVLVQACTQWTAWRDAYGERAPESVAVNVSVRQLEQDDFVAIVHGLLAELTFPPQRLLLEITESAFMKDEAEVVARLSDLRDLGVRLAIDDFGTGYSSLGRLSRLPVDTLKIDRSLVNEIDASPTGEALVSAAVAVAHSLGLRVIAEGVETPSQLESLRALGCDDVQGYVFSRPLSATDFGVALAGEAATGGPA